MGLNINEIMSSLGIGGGSAKSKRDIDFMKVYRTKGITADVKSIDVSGMANGIKVGAVAVGAIIIGYTAILAVTAVVKESKLKSIQEYLDSSADAQRYQQIQQMTAELDSIRNYNKLVDQVSDSIKTYPPFMNDDYTAVLEPLSKTGCRLESIDYDKGMIYLMIGTSDNKNCSKYIEALRSTGRFFDVTYNGYDGGTDPVAEGYKFSIKCKLKKGGSDK